MADMGIAHGRADILVVEQFLDFPQILSHLVEQDRDRGVAQPMRGDLPYPEGSTGRPQPQIERPVAKRRARISCKHKLGGREGDSAGSHDPAAFNFLLEGLSLEERCTQAYGNGHILEDASLALGGLSVLGRRQERGEPQTNPGRAFLCLQTLRPQESVCEDGFFCLSPQKGIVGVRAETNSTWKCGSGDTFRFPTSGNLAQHGIARQLEGLH
jgi:hypothetical protein